jgi:CRISPR-associated protein Cmr2
MIHDYYLSLQELSKIEDFENWKNNNQKRLNNKSEKDLYNLWLEEKFTIPLAIQKKKNNKNLKKDKDINCFYPKEENRQYCPPNSTLIKISFTLKKPYTSKDEGEFNVIDNKIFENPIVRDKFTGLPMVKPTTWKGHLRFAAERVECDKERKKIIIKRLFGSEPEEKENPLKGRLYFFPTFFDEEAEKEVITPLKRDTRTPARGPIPFEVMKPSKEGEFNLLYLPYPKGDNYQESQVDEDLEFLSKSLELMFYSYGFSAKKTSGFGVIERLKDDNVYVFPSKKKDKFSNLYKNLENNSQE